MASSLAKSHKGFRRMESRNKHSWWWDSHISPKNSKWLAENVEEMDQSVKRMLKLIEEDGDSFAKKAEIYYQKRPELVSHVEDFYRMYRSLAERYDNVTGELRKNIPTDLRSQGSGISDPCSEPSSRPRSGTRAAGFDFFLKSGGSSSDLGTKEGDESSTLDSESESDDSSVNNYSSASGNSDRIMRKRIDELESDLKKLQTQHEESLVKNDIIEEKLRFENEKLKFELQKYESLRIEDENHENPVTYDETEVVDISYQDRKIRVLEVDIKATREKLKDAEEELNRLRHELEKNKSANITLQEKLSLAQKEISGSKSKLDKEKREVLKLNDRITRYKGNLAEREREIRAMRETLSNANKTLSEENLQLQEHVTKLLKERALLDDTIKEYDLRCQSSDEELRRMTVLKTKTETELLVKVNDLNELKLELLSRAEQIDRLNQHLDELHLEHVQLVDQVEKSNKSIFELTFRNEELEKEVYRQREMVNEGAEEKREVIRQLCFSLEYYREGYEMIRKAFIGHNKLHPVMAS